MADPQTPQDQAPAQPLFDMSKAQPIAAPTSKPLFDMSKAQPISAPSTPSAGTVARRGPGGEQTVDPNILKEAGQGIVGSALEGVAGLGGLIQKIPVVGPKLVPQEGLQAESQIAEKLQQTPTQKLGAAAETVGEFATGDIALETGLDKLGKIAAKYPHVMEVLEKFPKASKKILGEAVTKSGETIAKQTTVGAAQGAVSESRPGGEGTAEGAKHGAEGAAIGSTAAEIIEAAAKPLMRTVGLATTAEQDITRAAQPAKRNQRFLKDWSIAKNRIAKEVEAEGKFESLGDAADRLRDVRQSLWRDEVQPKVYAHANEELFPSSALPVRAGTPPARNPVAEAIRDRIPKSQTVSQHTKAFNKAMEAKAAMFDGPMKVAEAEQLLEQMNAELDVKGYWKKTPSEKEAAQKADPYIASRVAGGDALREQLYNHLEKAGEPIKDLKREYGAIANVEKEISGQSMVVDRQRPVSLKTLIAVASGHPVGIAAAIADKIYNDPAAILNRAVSKATPDTALGSAVKATVSGAGAVAKKAAPVVGSIWFRASDGSIRTANADQWDEIQKVDPGAQQVHAGGGKK